MVELRAAPEAPIRYSTDGSDPKLAGAMYNGPFAVPPGTSIILAVAEKHGIVSKQHRLEIPVGVVNPNPIDPTRPALWKREHKLTTTQESYAFLERLQKYQVSVVRPCVYIAGQSWLELTCEDRLTLTADKLEAVVNHLRGLLGEGEVMLGAMHLAFPSGQQLLDWVAAVRTTLRPEEVEQS
jgi:hypothetical protein